MQIIIRKLDKGVFTSINRTSGCKHWYLVERLNEDDTIDVLLDDVITLKTFTNSILLDKAGFKIHIQDICFGKVEIV